jgi:hypothetical protein
MTHKGIIHRTAEVNEMGYQLCSRCHCRLTAGERYAPWEPGIDVVYERGGSSIIWPTDDISQSRECKAKTPDRTLDGQTAVAGRRS